MELLLFVRASHTSSGTTFHRTLKCCNSKKDCDIKNTLSGIMGNDLNFFLICSVEMIRQ